MVVVFSLVWIFVLMNTTTMIPPAGMFYMYVKVIILISGISKNFYEWKEFANQICNYFDKFYICSFSHINHRENKEKDTTDHEGSEEITQEQQYSQRYVYHLFFSQFSSDFFGLLHCYFATINDLLL